MLKLKMAIIGLGHLGSRHLKVTDELSEQSEIVAICDIEKESPQILAQKYNIPLLHDYKKLIGKVDAVSICTPTNTHFEVAQFFLRNNIHTFIEKPITPTVQEADELITLAEKNNLKLQIGHVERFNSGFESVRRFTYKPLFIECHRMNHFPNRSLDIGVVMDLMIHDIDIMLGLVDAPIKDIQAVGVNVLTSLDDIASVRITFENGCVCNLTASRISEEVTRKIRLFQSDTYISLDYIKQEAFIYKKYNKQILKHALPIEKEQPLKKEVAHFINCVQNNKQPLISGKEGREALKVALEINKKIWEMHQNT